MTTALDKLRGLASAARRDTLISTAEADILDRLARVAEDEDDERIEGALEELADNLRRALDCCVGRDDDGDDIPSTGCPTCDAVLDILGQCHGMSLRGTTAAEVAGSARDWIGDLIVERDNMRAERDSLHRAQHEAMQHLRPIVGSMTGLVLSAAGVASGYRNACRERDKALAEVASLRPRPTRDELADYARRMRSDDAPDTDAPDTDEPDDGWEPVLQWITNEHGQRVVVNSSGHALAWVDDYGDPPECFRAGVLVDSLKNPWRLRDDCTDRISAMRWCEAQPEMANVRAAYTSAPTVGATDAGPDAPALIVEGDAAEGAREARAVPAAPVSGAEQSCVETGVDRPAASDERIVGPREGEEWPFYGSWPYGYQVDDSGDERLLLTDQHEAMVMRLICQWHGDDVKSSEIAARLNRMALANRKGVRWYPAAVRTRIRTSYEEWREVFG